MVLGSGLRRELERWWSPTRLIELLVVGCAVFVAAVLTRSGEAQAADSPVTVTVKAPAVPTVGPATAGRTHSPGANAAPGGRPPVSAPPVSAPPVSAPPVNAPPVSAPPVNAPPVTTPPVAIPAGSRPPVSVPPVGAHPAGTPDGTPPPDGTPAGGPPPDKTPPDKTPPDKTPRDQPPPDQTPAQSQPGDEPPPDSPPPHPKHRPSHPAAAIENAPGAAGWAPAVTAPSVPQDATVPPLRKAASVRRAEPAQAPVGPLLRPLRMQNAVIGWLPFQLEQGVVPGEIGLASGSDGGRPPSPGPRAPSPRGCSPAGLCAAVPSSSHGPRPLGPAVLFTVDAPQLALPALDAEAPPEVSGLPPLSLIERPG
jgi:hypothetical protein